MDFSGRNVVITGGTGALGTAVVGALLDAGAQCHVPFRSGEEADRFRHKDSHRVKLYTGLELADESAVAKFYAGLSPLWASIHLAGGFAMKALAQSSKADVMGQIETN